MLEPRRRSLPSAISTARRTAFQSRARRIVDASRRDCGSAGERFICFGLRPLGRREHGQGERAPARAGAVVDRSQRGCGGRFASALRPTVRQLSRAPDHLFVRQPGFDGAPSLPNWNQGRLLEVDAGQPECARVVRLVPVQLDARFPSLWNQKTRSGGLQTADQKTTAVCKPPLLDAPLRFSVWLRRRNLCHCRGGPFAQSSAGRFEESVSRRSGESRRRSGA